MPEKKTIERARKDKRQGKAPSTQAGEFVHEEIDRVRQGRHGARSAKQAIAIGLSKARRAGVKVGPGKNASASTRAKVRSEERKGQSHASPSRRRSKATTGALRREGRGAVSKSALSRQAKSAARRRKVA